MENVQVPRRVSRTPSLFDSESSVQSAKGKTETNRLATLSDQLKEKHRTVRTCGVVYLDGVRTKVSNLPMPETLEFMPAKCTGLKKDLKENGQWPNDNALGWVENFIHLKESQPIDKKTQEVLDSLRLDVEMVRNLRKLDAYLIRGDGEGFWQTIRMLREHPPGSVEYTAAFLADH